MSEHAYVVRGTDPGRAPLMLLHGSNGRETDLLDLAQRVSPTSTRVGLRGTVTMSRGYGFFRRHEDRRVDESDLRGRVPDLAGCIRELAVGLGDSRPVAVGFSNGAIMAAALLMSHPSALGGAVLFRPWPPSSNRLGRSCRECLCRSSTGPTTNGDRPVMDVAWRANCARWALGSRTRCCRWAMRSPGMTNGSRGSGCGTYRAQVEARDREVPRAMRRDSKSSEPLRRGRCSCRACWRAGQDRAKSNRSPAKPLRHRSVQAAAISARPSSIVAKTDPGTQPTSPLMSRLLRP